jgi:hypothetical protein
MGLCGVKARFYGVAYDRKYIQTIRVVFKTLGPRFYCNTYDRSMVDMRAGFPNGGPWSYYDTIRPFVINGGRTREVLKWSYPRS